MRPAFRRGPTAPSYSPGPTPAASSLKHGDEAFGAPAVVDGEPRRPANDAGESAPRTKIDVRWLGAAISAGERGMACSYGVILLQDLSRALADDNAGCHCVARRHAGHDGTVCDAKVVDSIDPQIAINH
jgi:hypothetical protein